MNFREKFTSTKHFPTQTRRAFPRKGRGKISSHWLQTWLLHNVFASSMIKTLRNRIISWVSSCIFHTNQYTFQIQTINQLHQATEGAHLGSKKRAGTASKAASLTQGAMACQLSWDGFGWNFVTNYSKTIKLGGNWKCGGGLYYVFCGGPEGLYCFLVATPALFCLLPFVVYLRIITFLPKGDGHLRQISRYGSDCCSLQRYL